MRGKAPVVLILALFSILTLGTSPGLAEEDSKSNQKTATQGPGAERGLR